MKSEKEKFLPMEGNEREKVVRGDTRLAVKAGFWYVASNFLIKGLAFITTPIFARIMSKTAYGEFSSYASWQATLLIITSGELHNTVARAYYDYTDDFDQYVSSTAVASCLLTAVFYIIFLCTKRWIFSIVSIPPEFVHILFFTLMSLSCKSIFTARERTLYRYKTVAALSIINLLIPTLISIVLVMMANEANQLSARIYGFYLPSAIIGCICAGAIFIRGRTFKINHVRYAFALSLPLLAHYLTAYLLTSSNTIVTKGVLGAQSAAVVSITSSALHILTVFFQSISGAVTTWLMDNLEQREFGKIRRDSAVYVGMLSVVAIGVILMAPEVVWILGGKDYSASVSLIPGQVLAVLIQSVTSIFTIVLTYEKKIVKTAIFTGAVAVLSIVAKVFLLPLYGIQSLPIINIAAFGMLFIINYLLARKAGYKQAINIKGYAMLLAVVCLFMCLSPMLYENTMVRYGVVVLLGSLAIYFAYKKRALLVSFIRKKTRKKSEPKNT